MFYTGDRFPDWKNNVFVGGLEPQALVRLVLNGDRVVAEEHLLTERKGRVRDIKQAADGSLYLLSGSELVHVTPK
jgi:aldose sugar dehydrogenase